MIASLRLIAGMLLYIAAALVSLPFLFLLAAVAIVGAGAGAALDYLTDGLNWLHDRTTRL